MSKEPHDSGRAATTEEEYRRRVAQKAKRRKKRQTQRLILIGAFVLAAVLLVVCIIAIFNAIFGSGKKVRKTSSSSQTIVVPASLPNEGPGISWTVAKDSSVWNLILVNGQHPLPEDFKLADDQFGGIAYDQVKYWFDARIMDDMNAMITDCNAVEGHSLKVISGMRNADRQQKNYEYQHQLFKGQGFSEEEADKLARQVEPPSGYSEHQTGLAVDFITNTVNSPSDAFAETPEFKWLSEHAHEYGFILRYPSEKEAITGMKAQPYHFRYIGKDDAEIMHKEGTCLEEYLAKMPDPDAESKAENSSAPDTSVASNAEGEGVSDAGGDVAA